MSSISALNQRFVYVRVRTDEHYLLTLDNVYPGLPFAIGMTISAGVFGRVCSSNGTMITYRVSGGPVSRRVLRVEAVASKEAAETIAEERMTGKPKG